MEVYISKRNSPKMQQKTIHLKKNTKQKS